MSSRIELSPPVLCSRTRGVAHALGAGLAHGTLLASLLFSTVLLAAQPLAPVGSGKALTLPAQRHMVRIPLPDGSAVWLLALQQAGQEGRGLGFLRSDDEGHSWRHMAPIQDDSTHHDTADLVVQGLDVALVYSYEDALLSGSPRHDVWFQWWRYQPDTRNWAPSAPVRVFDSERDTTGYVRAELARDSRGRWWVQSFRLEADGSNTAVLALSTDAGRSFVPQGALATVSQRGGGRLLHLGDRVLFVYGDHGASAARLRMRLDAAPTDSWQPERIAFPEGIYHGAALSAVSTPDGRMHLVYKDVAQRLFYREFDGTTFGAATALETVGDWAVQPALTRVGDALVLFNNQPVVTNTSYQLVGRVLAAGRVGAPRVLESSPVFRGYLAVPEHLPASLARVPCVYGEAPDAGAKGVASLSFFSRAAAPASPVLKVEHTNTTHRFLTVAPSGTAYAVRLDEDPSRLYASTDGARTWGFKARHPLGGAFRLMSALTDGTLLANTTREGRQFLSRSGDGGATWSEVLLLGDYRMLTPHSLAELDGAVFLLEYQSFTSGDAPIRLHVSTDRGRSWSVRWTFTGHRHGHGLAADPVRHALWAFFGDTTRQAGTFRSTDAGRTWTRVLGGQEGNVVDAVVLGNGELLFGQDISYLPPRPHITQLAPHGTYAELALLSGPAYSTHPVRAGGFVMGAAREPGGDIYAPGDESAHVWASLDGVDWEALLHYPRLDPTANVRADVYDELPSGLLVLRLENARGLGAGGVGYQLLRFVRP